MSTPRRNIELKARCRDLTASADAARKIGAEFAGVMTQVDTYFHVPTGRLKLREINAGERTELIWYARPDAAAFRASDYFVIPIPDAQSMLAMLSAALGVRGKVSKRRDLWLWHNVRIHLDDVKGLGTFIEFEAVISETADEAISHERLAALRNAMQIADDDRVAGSYGDLSRE
jgi:predicted adenylyl cyclase CyaB